MKRIFVLLFFAAVIVPSYAYNAQDSIRIESLLASARLMKDKSQRVLYFGRQFAGTPYVAHTLDRNKEESLVINTRELDCTTFVETVVALTLCSERGETHFRDFCRQLQNIRYRGGAVGYTTRLHYFTDWAEDNQKMGFVKKIETKKAPFTAVQHVNVNYMSQHSSAYTMLAAHPNWLPAIKRMEQNISGRTYRYIPKSAIKNTKLLRSTIHDGDIIAIITNKKGLDTTHLGIASWKKDGLHLLNASQIYGKVIEDPVLFSTYMKKHPVQIGIRICRIQ